MEAVAIGLHQGDVAQSRMGGSAPKRPARKHQWLRFEAIMLTFVLCSFGSFAADLPHKDDDSPTVYDTHVHLWNGAESLRAYEEQGRAANVKMVGFAGMWFGGPNAALAEHPERIRESNDAHLTLARKFPVMLPIATVHPYDGAAALDEVSRVARLGFKVLKLHPHTQRFDPADPRTLAVCKLAGERGMVVLMDNFNIIPGDSEKLFNLALQAPKTRFIFAHLGGMNFRFWNVIRAARTAKGLYADNIYFDIAGTVVLLKDSPINDEFIWTIRGVGVDHVLLGSDYPQFSLAETLEAFEKLNLTTAEKDKIRYENARDLLGFKVN